MWKSTSGVSEGGRSGLTAVVTGLLFLAIPLYCPLGWFGSRCGHSPGPWSLLGVLMMGGVTGIDFNDFTEAFPAFSHHPSFMPLAYSIANGHRRRLFWPIPLVKLAAGRGKEVHWFTYILALTSLIHFRSLNIVY